MHQRFRNAAALLGLSLAGILAHANGDIAGQWQQFDDKSGQLRSIVRIDVIDGQAVGTIVKGFALPGKPVIPDAKCANCPGERRDKPLIGLRFLEGLKGGPKVWTDGEILDPDEGKVYRAKAVLSDDGQELTVRGYIGVSLFGRSQVWRRVDTTPPKSAN